MCRLLTQDYFSNCSYSPPIKNISNKSTRNWKEWTETENDSTRFESFLATNSSGYQRSFYSMAENKSMFCNIDDEWHVHKVLLISVKRRLLGNGLGASVMINNPLRRVIRALKHTARSMNHCNSVNRNELLFGGNNTKAII